MAKELQNLYWVEDLLPKSHVRKRMFGGFAYYVDEKLVLLMFESIGHKEYQGTSFDFEIWNGCMFPVEKENQPAVLAKYSYLISHPILPKWLYMPADSENFENHIEDIMPELRRKNPLFGTIPKAKAQKRKLTQSSDTKKGSEKIDTSKPRMFSDEPAESALLKARHITDLKNLGPATEKAFLKAGIKTPQQFIKLGWKKTMIKLCDFNPKNNHSLFAYAVIGALKNKMWNAISDEDKIEAREFMRSLRDKNKVKKDLSKKSKKKVRK